MNEILRTAQRYLETVYKDYGVWATLAAVVVVFLLSVVAAYLAKLWGYL